MSITDRQEKYCQGVADGLDPLDAMAKAGYKAKNKENSKAVLRRLQSRDDLNDRIAELQAIKRVRQSDEERAKAQPLPPRSQKKLKAMDFLSEQLNDPRNPMKLRVQCAMAILPYEQPKPASVGKKEQTEINAKSATISSRFATLDNQRDIFLINSKS